MTVNADAVFDVLSITARLKELLGGVAPPEVHLFAYLACILSLYDGKPVDDWGYVFAGTANGSPFSHFVNSAVEQLEASSLIAREDDLLLLTESGRQEYDVLRSLAQNAWREAYLAGACNSVLAIPVGLLRDALSREAALDRAAQLERPRPLLENADLETLYEQLHALSEAIGVKVSELMVPAVAWLSYLAQLPRRDASNVPS